MAGELWIDETEDKVTQKPRRRTAAASSRKRTIEKESIRSVFTKDEAEQLAKQAVTKITQIKTEIGGMVFEREHLIDDMFRALVAGENILLLGPPGTGKTYLAEIFEKVVTDSRLFKWLMNKTTDPADVIGPYSVKGMEKDVFRRILKGRAADAHFVYYDEIFKSNDPMLNYMLSMLNEGVVYNNGKPVEIPLRMAIGSSNEYPESEDLEAFYDRFLFRHWVNYITDHSTRIKMAASNRNVKATGKAKTIKTHLTLEEVDALQQHVKQIAFPPQIEKNYDRFIRALSAQQIHISDRRYGKAQFAMMASALLDGRDTVNSNDFKCLLNIMWNKDVKELEIVEKELSKFINPHEAQLKELLKKAEEVKEKTLALENRTERAAEAVQANSSLQDILGKMEDEIDEAQANKVDIKPFKRFIESTEAIMEEIADKCLKGSSRSSTRDW